MSHASACGDLALAASVDWPLVAAAPGYFALDREWPDTPPEPVLAWRIGPNVALPTTRHGYKPEETYVQHPDGIVRPHGHKTIGSHLPNFDSLDAWRDEQRRENKRIQRGRVEATFNASAPRP